MAFQPGFDKTLIPSASSRVIVLEGDQILTYESSVFLSYQQVLDAELPSQSMHHLGYFYNAPCFLLIAESTSRISDPSFSLNGLRSLLPEFQSAELAAAGRALQLAHWRNTHRFCGCCGTPTEPHAAELAVVCPACGQMDFPKIAPCVIGLVWKEDRCLLAHNARFKEGRYSVLAGFIEAGETAEQALIREVKEEVGIDIDQPEYITSQSWPFPSQLMLGYFAQYKGGAICEDGVEITHADWFAGDELPNIPPPETIAGDLIRRFFSSRTPT